MVSCKSCRLPIAAILYLLAFVNCCYKIITTIIIIIITSTSDLQPSTAVVNQLPSHLVSTQIRTIGINM